MFVARLEGRQEVPPNASRAKGFAAFVLNQEGTALRFFVFVTGLDFTGTQTADPGDDLVAAHIHAPAPRGMNAGVVFGFFGLPFNDINPNDVVVTPFARGVGGTVFSKWDLAEGNNTTLAAQLPNILAGLSYINFHTTGSAAVRSAGRSRRTSRSPPTSARSSPTGTATALASTSIRGAANCGWRKTATTRSPS